MIPFAVCRNFHSPRNGLHCEYQEKKVRTYDIELVDLTDGFLQFCLMKSPSWQSVGTVVKVNAMMFADDHSGSHHGRIGTVVFNR
jgi:hypothetical protein